MEYKFCLILAPAAARLYRILLLLFKKPHDEIVREWAHYVEWGIKSTKLSIPIAIGTHGANSFIHSFKFSVNRQRRIGGVATTSRSPKNR